MYFSDSAYTFFDPEIALLKENLDMRYQTRFLLLFHIFILTGEVFLFTKRHDMLHFESFLSKFRIELKKFVSFLFQKTFGEFYMNFLICNLSVF